MVYQQKPSNSLKYFSIGAGCWTIIWAIIQLIIFGLQMNYVKTQLSIAQTRKHQPDSASNIIHVNDGRITNYGDTWKYYYNTPEQRFYTALLIIQIFSLVLAALLFFTTICFIYGAFKYSKYLIWLWFINVSALVLGSFTFSIMWWNWAPDAKGPRLAMTVVEFIMGLINVAMLIVGCCLHYSFFKRYEVRTVCV